MQRQATNGARTVRFCSVLALTVPAVLGINGARAEQPPSPPCHVNPNADADRAAVAGRGDILNLPKPLQDRLVQLADRPHTYLPLQVFAEANGASQLFQYYLLDTTGFQPNVFTTLFSGVNDNVAVDRHRGELRTADGRRGAGGPGAQAGASHRSQQSARLQ